MTGSSSDCILLEKEESGQQAGIPICGGNISSPVTDISYYINDVCSGRDWPHNEHLS